MEELRRPYTAPAALATVKSSITTETLYTLSTSFRPKTSFCAPGTARKLPPAYKAPGFVHWSKRRPDEPMEIPLPTYKRQNPYFTTAVPLPAAKSPLNRTMEMEKRRAVNLVLLAREYWPPDPDPTDPDADPAAKVDDQGLSSFEVTTLRPESMHLIERVETTRKVDFEHTHLRDIAVPVMSRKGMRRVHKELRGGIDRREELRKSATQPLLVNRPTRIPVRYSGSHINRANVCMERALSFAETFNASNPPHSPIRK